MRPLPALALWVLGSGLCVFWYQFASFAAVRPLDRFLSVAVINTAFQRIPGVNLNWVDQNSDNENKLYMYVRRSLARATDEFTRFALATWYAPGR